MQKKTITPISVIYLKTFPMTNFYQSIAFLLFFVWIQQPNQVSATQTKVLDSRCNKWPHTHRICMWRWHWPRLSSLYCLSAFTCTSVFPWSTVILLLVLTKRREEKTTFRRREKYVFISRSISSTLFTSCCLRNNTFVRYIIIKKKKKYFFARNDTFLPANLLNLIFMKKRKTKFGTENT